MDILLLDALVPEAMAWLETRHTVQYRPELADDMVVLRKAAYKSRGIVFPRQTVVTREFLDFMPKLKAVGRLHVGTDNTDLEACKERGIKVIHASSANVRSNAEYLLSSLLLLYRRGVVSALMGRRHPSTQMGRELHGSTVGILGLAPTAHTLAGMLTGLGVRLIGYDPAVHHTAPIWERLRIQPVTLTELVSQADAVSVQMLYAERFRSFVNEKLLAACKHGQLWVGISRSALFDENALAAALCDGRIEACILDGAEDNFTREGSPVQGLKNLFITPRLGSHTREARLRSSWYVAHRMHEAIMAGQQRNADSVLSAPMDLELPGAVSPSQWSEPGFVAR
ncbi:MAG: NAD(P)-dependent oxidoreductase [Polaromonas sp.]|uniref:NAD(P)-dependent oxidoreductase n=1 Tax=Polaromonas sp. TaxID=1869339 RepID=UPI0024881071|nr:NAD(P)-dependent oxidoreductase [Polaromonas sp.]MDI1271834.1 NAD(P)-dependent oxidoreductase [Polaromonas sp.]MDO9113859.1 NAD(P)-dependent oxidoreductase [Polaromonas sp.]MDP1888154.1 NAD(P)-dependent oxidoreductase [Polaromonas sp.]